MRQERPIQHTQPDIQPPPFDGYNRNLPVQQALGSAHENLKKEVSFIQSVNFVQGVKGWRFTPLGLEINTFDFAPGSIVFSDIQNIASQRILGRSTAGSGSIEELTGTLATAMLDVFTGDAGSGGLKGLVPAPVAGDATKFLKGNGTWATPPSGGGGGGTDSFLRTFLLMGA